MYRLDQLHDLVEKWGLPEDPAGGYDSYESRPFEMYVEVQLWSDEPIARFLRSGV